MRLAYTFRCYMGIFSYLPLPRMPTGNLTVTKKQEFTGVNSWPFAGALFTAPFVAYLLAVIIRMPALQHFLDLFDQLLLIRHIEDIAGSENIV